MRVINNTPFVHARVYLQYVKSALPGKNRFLNYFPQKIWRCLQVDNELKEREKKSKFKFSKIMKSTSKTRFNNLLLSITFNDKIEDLNLIFYIWVFNKTIEVIMKKKSQI